MSRGWYGNKMGHKLASKGIRIARGYFRKDVDFKFPVYMMTDNSITYVDDDDYDKIYEYVQESPVVIDYAPLNGVLMVEGNVFAYDESVLEFPNIKTEKELVKELEKQNLLDYFNEMSARQINDNLKRDYITATNKDGTVIIRARYVAEIGGKLSKDDFKQVLRDLEFVSSMESIEIKKDFGQLSNDLVRL